MVELLTMQPLKYLCSDFHCVGSLQGLLAKDVRVGAKALERGGQNLKNAPRKTREVNFLVFAFFVEWTNDPQCWTIMFLWDSKF